MTHEKNGTTLDRLLRRHSHPSPERMHSAIERVAARLRAGAGDVAPFAGDRRGGPSGPPSRSTPRIALAAAAAFVLAASMGTAILWPRGATVYATDEAGTQFTLDDDSRVEMRAHSELTVDRAADGIRMHLRRGGIIVHAADRSEGHLYVETKDVSVSVVGTVFLVNAGEEGSRVAVIEGEVRVRQGSTEQTLMPGEQVATNPLMPSPPVREAVAWSRNAAALVALLQQVDVVPPAVSPQNSTATREAFEVASIRPTRFVAGGERGAGSGGGATSPRPAGEPCGSTGSGFLQWDPKRVAISDMTLYGLIAWAYELPCRPWNGSHVLVGGPGWVQSDGYDIQALFPEGPPAYTSTQITQLGRTFTRYTMGPRFRTLLQSLLADRFGLVLRREQRDVPVYALTVAPGGLKVTPWKEGDPATVTEYNDWHARNGTLLAEEQMSILGLTPAQVAELHAKSPGDVEAAIFRGYRSAGVRALYTLGDVKASMGSLAEVLSRSFDNANWRPVVDRTGFTGVFNYRVHYDRSPAPDAVGPTIFTALEKELGLRLAPSTAPMEVFVIERAERPSEN